jgi:protein-S-isoprenylcysteine O-methyltransferase Ste14
MTKPELKTGELKESAAGVSEFCEPEQRNDAAAVGVIHSFSPRRGTDENTGEAKMSIATASAPIPAKAPAWAVALGRVNHHIMNDFGGGPRPWKLAWVINFQKLGTLPLLGVFIAWYHNTSAAAWIYLAMHGSCCLVWIIKDLAFPDPNFQKPITIGAGIASFLSVLGWYWVFGWLLISGVARPAYPLPDYAWFCLCISLCILGCVIMIAADAQKYFTLRVKRELITNGMHRFIRHPNYLGEMMTYGSFALMVWHWLPVVVLAWIWGGLFAVNMTLKEASMSRYPEWAEYKKRSWWLLPWSRRRSQDPWNRKPRTSRTKEKNHDYR